MLQVRMLLRIPTVLRSQELIDKAFSRASRIEEPYYPDKAERIKKEVQDRISTIESISRAFLDRLVKKFPSINNLHPFYSSLIDLMFDIDQYKISLSKIDRTSQMIEQISGEHIRRIKAAKTVEDANRIMRSYYGRFASLIHEIDQDLLFLGRCRDYMKKIPDIDVNLRTYIIAGMPNVGKSSLLAALTTKKPQIAPYPFTTKSVIIGIAEHGYERIQFIDTPGILDRDFNEMNQIEKNAVLALRHINGTVIFLFDYSDQALYSPEMQEHLYQQIRDHINPNIIRVQTKMDISRERREEIAISVNSDGGLDPLRLLIFGRTDGNVRG
ncbi:MAG: NOG1 family protein [Thermoplasma sp.]|nr:MAG: NOG1 family protein [Thermoplasma sp.]